MTSTVRALRPPLSYRMASLINTIRAFRGLTPPLEPRAADDCDPMVGASAPSGG